MDKVKVLRHLLINKFMGNSDYHQTKFWFLTVWYKTAYSYCCCPCTFEHEFLEYISKTGEIDEPRFAKIVDSIVAGQCLHVYQVPPDYIQETCICGLHVAAASGASEALIDALDDILDTKTGLLNLSPYQILLIKRPDLASKLCLQSALLRNKIIYVKHRRLRDTRLKVNKIRIEKTSAIECLFREGDISDFKIDKRMYCSEANFVTLLYHAFRHDLEDLELFLKRQWRKIVGIGNIFEECCLLAIIYNKSDFLYSLIHTAGYNRNNTCSILVKTCDLLQQQKCKQVLVIKQNTLNGGTYNKLDAFTVSDKDFVTRLLNHVLQYGLECIIPILRVIPNISSILNGQSILHTYNFKITSMCSIGDPRLFKMILDLNVDINHMDANGMPPFIHMLYRKTRCNDDLFRDIEELYVFENLDLDVHRTALLHALRFDKAKIDVSELHNISGKNKVYIIDCHEHGIQGHDEVDLVLNFMVPFLIECGFPVTQDFLEEFEDTCDYLHPLEQVYISQSLQTPRSLLLSSRDTLRRHFQGRFVHSFVEAINVPQSVKDFILLKPLLKSVPKYLLY